VLFDQKYKKVLFGALDALSFQHLLDWANGLHQSANVLAQQRIDY